MSFLLTHWIATLSSLIGVGGIGALAVLFPVQALGVLKWVMTLNLAQIGCIVLGIALAIDHGALLVSHHETASWKQQYTAEHQGRLNDQAAYKKAQADAAAKNLATVAADRAERERISNEYANYPAELASLRADLARRLPTNAAPSSAPGKPGVSDLPNPAAAPNGSGAVCISSDAYVSAAQTELQLDRLEQWVNEQMKVDPNK